MPSRILIVDDEPFNLDLLDQELTDLGYAIERASNGAQALQLIERSDLDLVLLDYQMPGAPHRLRVSSESSHALPSFPSRLPPYHSPFTLLTRAILLQG